MSRLLSVIWQDIVRVIPAVIFFAITFNLITLTETLMLRHGLPSHFSYALATLAALVVGKFILIVNTFPYINAFPNKPLIYNITWKLVFYGIFLVLFRVSEKALDFFLKYNNTEVMYRKMEVALANPVFWAVQIWLIMSFTVYIVATEFMRAIGRDQIMMLLIGRK